MANLTEPVGSHRVHFSIRTKLFLLVLIAFGLLIGLVIVQIGREAGQSAQEAIDHSLQRSEEILFRRLESRFSTIAYAARGIARDGRVFPEVYAGASPTLQDLSGEFQDALGCDLLMFTDAAGKVLARSDNPEAIGDNAAERSDLFRTVLEGEAGQGLMARRGELLQIVALPIFDNAAEDLVRGSIAMAYLLTEDLVQEIETLSDSEIVLCSFAPRQSAEEAVMPRVYRSTLQPERVGKLEGWFGGQAAVWAQLYEGEAVGRQILNLDGETFHAAYFPLLRSDLLPVGFVMALRSHTELTAPFRRIQRSAGFAGLFCLLSAILVAWYIARRITGPIIALVDQTEQIENGIYPSVEPPDGGDEVAVLGRSVHRMSTALRNKAALEQYLVELSENLQDTIVSDEFALQVTGLTTSDPEQTAAPDQETELSTLVEASSPSPEARVAAAPAVPPSPDEPGGTSKYSRKELFDVQFLSGGALFAERYQLVRELGSGGMGTVYLATDEQLQEPVAIKLILNPKVTEKILDRFRQELRLARRITHSNVLRNHDLGVYNGLHYISMEYMPGVTLFELISKHGPLNLSMAVIMARQMCSAVAAAHTEGIVHRDLKPQNMMINRQGILKIMDFGIAANVEEEIASGRKQVTGTPHFMAPEQFAGTVDMRSDIYALGIIMHFLVSGKLPFWETTLEGFKDAHVYKEPPPIRSLVPEAPKVLEQIILRALEKHPDDRFQDVREMQTALTSIQLQEPDAA